MQDPVAGDVRVVVDLDLCELHGQCVIAAPEIFSFSEDGSLVVADRVPAELRAHARAAAAVCPAAAITELP